MSIEYIQQKNMYNKYMRNISRKFIFFEIFEKRFHKRASIDNFGGSNDELCVG